MAQPLTMQAEASQASPNRKAGRKTGVQSSKATHDGFIQPKLKVGQPNDRYEQEADAMADTIVNRKQANHSATNTPIQRKCGQCAEEESVQRKEDEETTEEQETVMPLQRKELSAYPIQRSTKTQTTSPSSEFEQQLQASKGRGQALGNKTRGQMESGFGVDLSGVRIHTDNTAVQMSNDIGAHAFTHGNDIYFNQGKYQPDSQQGKHLLAHELTHTLQQRPQRISKRPITEHQRLQRKAISKASSQRMPIPLRVKQYTHENSIQREVSGTTTRERASIESAQLDELEAGVNRLMADSAAMRSSTQIRQLMALKEQYAAMDGTVTFSGGQMRDIEGLYRSLQPRLPYWASLPEVQFSYSQPQQEVTLQRTVMAAPAAGAALGGGIAISIPVWVIIAIILAVIIVVALIIYFLLDDGRPTPEQEAEAERLTEEALRKMRRPQGEQRPRPDDRPPPPPPPPRPRRRRICYRDSLVLTYATAGRLNPLPSGMVPTPTDLRTAACSERAATGTTDTHFQRRNIAVGRFRVGSSYHVIASANPERNIHSEDAIVSEAERRWPGRYRLDALFTERKPCTRCARNIYGLVRPYYRDFRIYSIINNDYQWTEIRHAYFGIR